ncbi:MAG: hydroxymethylbilane synthase [Solirubrobacteraceae bacterium MAG38_C4-C5]|nr:hydroxymethylbilane synthase [Candidatus Siliceabacter maunaloa]
MRLGTRGSALALAQAHAVAEALGGDVEVVTITTSGDRDRGRPNPPIPDKEKWVKELELALLAGEVDLAVHSAKDVPTALPDGLVLVGAPPRADPRDALCGAPSLAALPAGARVGTASLRRTAQVRALREDLEVVELRGNVDTRLGKLAAGEVDAALLAVAGLARLGREDAVDAVLDELVPAPGQGVIALEARKGDEAANVAAAAITDAPSWAALQTERTLVAALGASCDTPLGVHAVDGLVRTFVGLPDGSAWLRDEAPAAEALERLLSAGAADLLRRAEAMAAP